MWVGGGGRGVAFVREDMQSLPSLPPSLSLPHAFSLSVLAVSLTPPPPPPEKRKQTKGLHRLLLRRPRLPRGKTLPQIRARLRADLPGTVRTNWLLWVPANFVNFRFVPCPCRWPSRISWPSFGTRT